MTVKTAAQALALVRREGLVTLAAHVEGVPCFVEAVTGERVRGSWWGHPKGKLIFTLAEGLEDSGEVLVVKLLEGKATFVHRDLWPGLLELVLDPSFRAPRVKRLSAAARALLKKVEKESRRGEAARPVKELEDSLLVYCASEHTEKGRHEKRLTSWVQWAKTRHVHPLPSGEGALSTFSLSLRERLHRLKPTTRDESVSLSLRKRGEGQG